VLHFHAALRCPELYRGVVMLDSPVLTLADQWVIRAAKRFGFIDRITPAGRTLGRREAFADLEAARRYFATKTLFKRFDPECFDAYLQHGLQADGEQLRLRFDPATEISIYRSIPHTSPGGGRRLRVPLAVVRGEHSRVVLPHHARSVRRMPLGEHLSMPGGHMFPLEQPDATAQLLKTLFARWAGA
jgi:pimeloyl-ACP methyl ester carboxylesterase